MSENRISNQEAIDLVSKLFTERIDVCASFFSPSGALTILRGKVDSITKLRGIVVSVDRPPSPTGWVSVLTFERNFVCSYGDKREFKGPGTEQFVERFGDSLLSFFFPDSGEVFCLTFTL